MTHIALVLFLAFLGGTFISKLRLPSMVGYILAGALIGPGLLGLQGPSTEIQWLAELGIILLLFLLGLEIDIERFRSSVTTALAATLWQVALGLALMLPVAFYFGWSLPLGLILGFLVALSSTAIAIGMLKDLGAQGTHTERLATAILVAQDILVVPMLLLVGAFGAGTPDMWALARVGFALILVALSMWAIFTLCRSPYWCGRLGAILSMGRKQPVIAGLAFCFGAAALTGALGLSTAYGAFILGLLIGNMGAAGAPYRVAIEPIRDLLLMVFFLSIGLMLDVRFVIAHWLEIGLLLGAVVLAKTILNVVILRMLGVADYRAYTLGGALAQVGEFGFVLIAAGLASGFIDRDGYQLALAVIALSLVVSPLWLTMVRTYLEYRHIYLSGTKPDAA